MIFIALKTPGKRMPMGGENPALFQPDINGYLNREAIERLGIVKWLEKQLHDPRDQDLSTRPLPELLHT